MRRAPSTKLRTYLALSAAGSLAGIALGRPQLVALVAPFAAFVALGLALEQRPEIEVHADIGHPRMLEDEELPIVVTVTARSPVERLDVELEPGQGTGLVPGEQALRFTGRLDPGEEQELRFSWRAAHWGTYRAG